LNSLRRRSGSPDVQLALRDAGAGVTVRAVAAAVTFTTTGMATETPVPVKAMLPLYVPATLNDWLLKITDRLAGFDWSCSNSSPKADPGLAGFDCERNRRCRRGAQLNGLRRRSGSSDGPTHADEDGAGVTATAAAATFTCTGMDTDTPVPSKRCCGVRSSRAERCRAQRLSTANWLDWLTLKLVVEARSRIGSPWR